jgi:broad specificity phosphatase PhoE
MIQHNTDKIDVRKNLRNPMKITLYFVRHGETRFNEKGRMQGTCDSPLSVRGELQVEQARVALNNVFFDRAYSSPSGRCLKTCKKILEGRHIRPQIIHDLHEMDFGTFEGSRFTSHPDEISYCFEHSDFTSVNGENSYQVTDRFQQALDLILSESRDGDHVLVVSHGAALMNMMKNILNIDVDNFAKKHEGRGNPVPNAGIMSVVYDDGEYHVTNLPTQPQLFENPLEDKIIHFYYVNHGQTLFNQYNRMQGVSDSALTERGINEAIASANALKDIELNAIYTSPMTRCIETAMQIAHDRNIEPISLEGLREIDFGQFEGVVRDNWLEEIKEHRINHDDWSDVGGESQKDFEQRFEHMMIKLVSASRNGSNIVMVGHSEHYKRILEILFGLNAEEVMMNLRKQGKQPHPYGGIFQFDYVNGEYKIVEYMRSPETD